MRTLIKRKLTRGDCLKEARPCQRHCPYRLDGAESCALDVADRGGVTLQAVADLLGVDRTTAGKIEDDAMRKLCRALGVSVPDRDDYRDREVSGRGWRKRSDDDALAAIAAIGGGTVVEIARAMPAPVRTASAALARLLSEGRVVRHRVRVKPVTYAYEIAAAEAAE